MKNFRFPAVAAAALATTLVAFPALSDTPRAAETEPRQAAAVPAAEETPTPALRPAEETAERGAKTKRVARERVDRERAAREQAAREMVAARTAPRPEPQPEPQPERPPERDVVRATKAGAAIAMLPGPAAEAPKAEEEPPRPVEPPPGVVTGSEPAEEELFLSIPRLGIEEMPLGDSPVQEYLDREGLMHLSGTSFPYERGSNTYIVGHAADFDTSRVPNVFQDLKDLQTGDTVTLRDSAGVTYDYRIYDRLVVAPSDVWVTEPVEDRNIISLQTCFPEPTFDKRLIVRGQLVS